MYIGSTSVVSGLHHLVYEIVDNAIDEALAGYCTHIEVDDQLPGDIITRRRQRPRHPRRHPAPDWACPALEVVFTVLHAGGKFGGGGYKVSGGLHGVGAIGRQRAVRVARRSQVHKDGQDAMQMQLRPRQCHAAT